MQSFSLVSRVLAGIDQVLSAASKTIESLHNDLNKTATTKEYSDSLRQLSKSLFEQTNSAGLQIPVSLYGDQGLYEMSLLYPLCSLDGDCPNKLERVLDETSFHVAIVLWALGCDQVLEAMVGNEALRQALVDYLQACADLAGASASVMACPRKNWSLQKTDCRESITTNLRLFGSIGRAASAAVARRDLDVARERCRKTSVTLEECTIDTESIFNGLLLWEVVKDLSYGDRKLAHQSNDSESSDNMAGEGSLGRMSDATVDAQGSWSSSFGLARQLFRLCYLEQMLILFRSWVQGCVALYEAACLNLRQHDSFQRKPVLRRRGVRRSIQFVTGTWALYAMATWWDEYSTLLGSSSTGQWTMVAFYVCFRATCEETVNAAILRSIGHAIGALLSWGVNTAATSNGSRMGAHLALNLFFTWFIPPPFVYPSSISFGFDKWLGEGLLEGALTTYHLTSVLVFSTSIESAAKARALSQCVGSLAAALVSLLVLPWYAKVETKRTLDRFLETAHCVVESLGGGRRISSLRSSLHGSVEELLDARRDWSGAMESRGWFVSLLNSLGIDSSDSSDTAMTASLSNAAIGGFALEGILKHLDQFEAIGNKDASSSLTRSVASCLCDCSYDDCLSAIRDTISKIESKDDTREQMEELSTIYVLVVLLKESTILSM